MRSWRFKIIDWRRAEQNTIKLNKRRIEVEKLQEEKENNGQKIKATNVKRNRCDECSAGVAAGIKQ